ncbi:hypothetical protein KC959_03725 [Candidatus Saccharibacteria bacterium]|nr:hypothetical protein [Candidatus Saccharibacteria bacterium]
MSRSNVFHLTLEDRLKSLEVGLFPSGSSPLTPDQERWASKVDPVRPEWIRRLGISRVSAVYAYPLLETARRVVDKCTSPDSEGQKMVGISIDVDPERAVVCDSWTLGEAYSGKDYWRTAVTLDAFRRYFNVSHTEHGLLCEVNEAGRGNTSVAAYLQPEVLLPGVIDPSRLVVSFVSTHPIKPTIKW